MGLLSAATALLPKITDIVGEFVEDKDKANEIAERITTQSMDILARSDANQAAINLQDAKSDKFMQWFWRPWFCFWLCNIYLVIVILPYITAFWDIGLAQGMSEIKDPWMHVILMGILGLAGMRTYDKQVGNTRK